jgi:RNA polymerase sigma factor (sigma-70 family)
MQVAEEQLDAWARRYEHRVSFFARKVQRSFMLGSRWNDDLVSAGYWGLFKAVKNRRPDSIEREFSAYVSQRIHGAVIDAARTCISRVAKCELSLGASEDNDWEEAFQREGQLPSRWVSDAGDPEEMASMLWRRSAIHAALDQLCPSERRVLQAYMEGASLSEIARDEGIPIGTMQGRFRKLTQNLRSRAPELRRVLLDRDSC